MSWDGVGRRPIRDKQEENKRLRLLMLSILKSHETVFDRIVGLPLSKPLLEAFLEARRLDGNFKARRRIERHVVNLMRASDQDEIGALQSLIHDPEHHRNAYEEEIDAWLAKLVNSSAALSDFIEDRKGIDVQQLRSLIRAVKKTRDTSKTAPKAKLRAYLKEWIA